MAALPTDLSLPLRHVRGTVSLAHFVQLLCLGTAWGLQFTFLKIATDAGLPEINILTIVMVLLAGMYLSALGWTANWFWPAWRHIRFFFVGALFGFVLPLGAVILAARDLTAGLIVFFEALTPVFTIAFALVFRTELITGRRVLAVGLGLVSVLIVLSPAMVMPTGIAPLGLLVACIIPCAYTADGIYVAARWPHDLNSLQVVTGEMVAGAIMVSVIFAFVGEPMAAGSSRGWGYEAVIGFLVVTCFEAFLYFHLLVRAGAVFVSNASFVSLFAGVGLGIMLLGERHTPTVWLAIGIGVVALYLLKVHSRTARSAVRQT